MWIMNCPFTIKWTSLYYHFLFFWPEKFTGRNLFSALSACVGKWSSSDGDIGANKEMQVAGVGADAGGTVAGRTVGLVAVKLDCASKELLTWALVNVAQPGDLVIALHVLDDSSVTGLTLSFSFSLSISLRYSSLLTVFAEGASSLVSIVNAFDSMVAVYQGFCNLKQVRIAISSSKSICAPVCLLP